jgi:hypothetical protein
MTTNLGMVETVEIRQMMWLVMLEYAKDRVIGVDSLEQQVPPRVRYGMTCLLIRDDWEVCLARMSGNLV